jgi:hypothetical protein
MNDPAQRILDFLRDIDVEIREEPISGSTFLPGIRVVAGALVVDRETLRWPGDLLHEAAHIAITPVALRKQLNDAIEEFPAVEHAGEIEATAWAYAAVVHLSLDPVILFHEGGYQGQSTALIHTYSLGVYPGSYGLAQIGLTQLGEQAKQLGSAAYPHMQKWLRD